MEKEMNKLEQASQAEDPSKAMEMAVAEYDRVGKKIAEYSEIQVRAKQLMQEILEELGTASVKAKGRTVMYHEPTTFEAFDTNLLKSACTLDPQLNELVEPCKVIRSKKGYVSVR